MKNIPKNRHNPNRNEKIGRGNAMDSLGAPVQNDPTELTTSAPKIEQSQVDYGTTQFGQGANKVGGSNISSQLSQLINTGISTAASVVDIAHKQQKRKDAEVEDNRLEQMRELMTNGVDGTAWVNMSDEAKLNAQQVLNRRAAADTTLKSSRRPIEAEIFKNQLAVPSAQYDDLAQKYQTKKNDIELATYEHEWQRVDDLVAANEAFYTEVQSRFKDNGDIMDSAQSTVAGFAKADRSTVDAQARRELTKNKGQIEQQVDLMLAAELDGTAPVLDETAFANNVLVASGYPQEFLDASDGAVIEAFDPIFKKYVADRRRNATQSLTTKINEQNKAVHKASLITLEDRTVGPGINQKAVEDSRNALKNVLDDPNMTVLQRDNLLFDQLKREIDHLTNRSSFRPERNEQIGRDLANDLMEMGGSDRLRGWVDKYLSPDQLKPIEWSAINLSLASDNMEKLVDIAADDTAMQTNVVRLIVERAMLGNLPNVQGRVVSALPFLKNNPSKTAKAEKLTTNAALYMVNTGSSWMEAWASVTAEVPTNGVGAELTQEQLDALSIAFNSDPGNTTWMKANSMIRNGSPTSDIALEIKKSLKSNSPESINVDEKGQFVPYEMKIASTQTADALGGTKANIAGAAKDIDLPTPPSTGMEREAGAAWAMQCIETMFAKPGVALGLSQNDREQNVIALQGILAESMGVRISDSASVRTLAIAVEESLVGANISTQELAQKWLTDTRKNLVAPMKKIGARILQDQIDQSPGFLSYTGRGTDADKRARIIDEGVPPEDAVGTYVLLHAEASIPTALRWRLKDMGGAEVLTDIEEMGLVFDTTTTKTNGKDQITSAVLLPSEDKIREMIQTPAFSITTSSQQGLSLMNGNINVPVSTRKAMRESSMRIVAAHPDNEFALSASRVLDVLAGTDERVDDLKNLRHLQRSKGDAATDRDRQVLGLLIPGDTQEIPAGAIIALTILAEQNPLQLNELLGINAKEGQKIFAQAVQSMTKDSEGNWMLDMSASDFGGVYRSQTDLKGFTGVSEGTQWWSQSEKNKQQKAEDLRAGKLSTAGAFNIPKHELTATKTRNAPYVDVRKMWREKEGIDDEARPNDWD